MVPLFFVCDQTTFLCIDTAQFQLTVQLVGISVVSSVFVILTMLPWLSMHEFFCVCFFSSLEPKTETENWCVVTHPNLQHKKMPVFLPLSQISLVLLSARFIHWFQMDVVPYSSFHFHFSNKCWWWASFHVLIDHLCIFFGYACDSLDSNTLLSLNSNLIFCFL